MQKALVKKIEKKKGFLKEHGRRTITAKGGWKFTARALEGKIKISAHGEWSGNTVGGGGKRKGGPKNGVKSERRSNPS